MPKLQQVVNAFRAHQIGDSDLETRSRVRYRRALGAGLTSAAARAVSISSILISIPLTLKYLGVERFGVWMTIISLTSLLTFADLGLGNGLMNAVARCHANGDSRGVRVYISSALMVLVTIATIAIAAAITLALYVPWNRLLAVDPKVLSDLELGRAMMAFVICLAIGIPTAVVQKAQLALQLGYMANLWQLTANIAGFAALLTAMKVHASLTWLVIASLATPAMILLLSAFVFWVFQRPNYRPSAALSTAKYARELLHSGSLFFVIQVAGAIAFGSDTLIIAHLLDATAVAQYSVVARLADGIVMVSALFLTPLWPAYADAHARGESDWIKKTLIRSLCATAALTIVMSTILVFVSRPLTLAWVGPAVAYSLALFVACSIWAVIKATGNALAMFLNGLGWIGFQAFLAVVFAVVATLAKIALTRRFGLMGIPIALAISYLIIVALPYAAKMPKILGGVSR